MKIILASGSPRRRQIMELAGIPCEVIVSGVDETISGEPDYQVKELALRKAKAVKTLSFEGGLGGTFSKVPPKNPLIIGADTLVYIDGRVLGKPEDSTDAFDMLKALQGRWHTVYTGVALVQGEREIVFADATRVRFRELSNAEIYGYIETGEPFDKAGAYGVQERGSVLVDSIEGDFYTVVGLPISKVSTALAEMGYDIWGRA